MYFNSGKRYNNFGGYLKKRFKSTVYKVIVDAGFTCPNRDGTKGVGGCIYCNNSSFRPDFVEKEKDIIIQIKEGVEYLKKRYNAQKFIVYFQPYTNTYENIEKLKKLYYDALNHPDVIGLSIGTRPDCIDNKVLELFQELSEKTYLWIEYGLQTMHNQTLKFINRGHTFEDFDNTYKKTKNIKNINICIHIIHGLPNETKEMMLDTVKYLAKIKIDGIKIHQLHIVKDTLLEKLYDDNQIVLPTLDEYLDVLAKSLELLPNETLIQRLFGLGPKDILIAPDWNLRKANFTQIIDDYLEKVDTFQGKFYNDI